MFQRSLPSFSMFFTYGFKNLGREAGQCCFPTSRRFVNRSWFDKLFHVVGL